MLVPKTVRMDWKKEQSEFDKSMARVGFSAYQSWMAQWNVVMIGTQLENERVCNRSHYKHEKMNRAEVNQKESCQQLRREITRLVKCADGEKEEGEKDVLMQLINPSVTLCRCKYPNMWDEKNNKSS